MRATPIGSKFSSNWMPEMRTLFMLAIAIFASGCGNYLDPKHTQAAHHPPQVERGDAGTAVYFAEIFEQILQPQCLRCHANYSDYSDVSTRLNEILRRVQMDDMPRSAPPLSADLKALLLAWVEAGAPERQERTSPPPDENTDDDSGELIPLEANWISLNQNVFGPKCAICHQVGGIAGFLDLSKRQTFFEQREWLLNFDLPESSHLIEVISDPVSPMPPISSSANPVTAEELAIIIEWIKFGLP